MTDLVISARSLTKAYRLYSKPRYRFLDAFGLLPQRPGAYTEHLALDHVDLDIRRGEKVAIIGRNGAGKSTFLKLVTGVVHQTRGSLTVRGMVHALLQIGTGFHPDFTGRENVYSYLAHLGVGGATAQRKFREIVEFAELEEYIDQPLKTYSTGMGVRLMFSTSTAIAPEILVIDEVLGVGDAYFSHKSYERMREMCEGAGTTLLLVTHDVYSAVQLCERIIWIDRGRVLMDADGSTVVKAYEDSIRTQEERRLRLSKQAKLEERGTSHRQTPHLLLEILSRQNLPQPSCVYFSRISLARNGTIVSDLPLGDNAFADEGASHLQREATCWGEPTLHDGRTCRAMLNYGSPFHKVAGVFQGPDLLMGSPQTELEITTEYWSEEPCDLLLRAYLNGTEISLGSLPPSVGTWAKHTVLLKETDGHQSESECYANTTGLQGSGLIAALDVKVLDSDGRETHHVLHGKSVEFLVDFYIRKPDLSENAEVLITLHRNGTEDVCRFLGRSIPFDAQKQRRGRISLHVPRLNLANGRYSISLMIVKDGYWSQTQTIFYSVNPAVYTCWSRVFDIIIEGAGALGDGTVVVADGVWSVLGEGAAKCRATAA